MKTCVYAPAVAVILIACAVTSHAFEFAVPTPDARPVSHLTSTTAVLNWETTQICETKIQLREGTFPAGTPGHEDVWKDPKVITFSVEPMRKHSMLLTGLKPATKYYYRYYDPGASLPEGEVMWSQEPPWSREYAFATFAKPGEKAFIQIPVKVLIVTNVIDFPTIKEGVPKPEPMTEEEIEMYKREFNQAALYYWVNSGMMYWMDMEFFIDPEWQRVGDEPEGIDDFYKGWREARPHLRIFDSADISKHEAVSPLKEKKIYTGQVIMRCTRQWNERSQEWVYQGSGGGTFGVGWMHWQADRSQQPVPGRSQFLGGSDICWLMVHEYKHQLESQHKFSGLETENDRTIFCHYAPRFVPPIGEPWKWDTAYAHGRHFDGIAYELRVMTPVQYMRNMFGHVEVTKDADRDGVPDDDPRLPLDEKRFGSDPRKMSTDGSGITDLEKIMYAKWVPAVNQNSRGKLFTPGYSAMWEMASGESLGTTEGGYAYPKAREKDSDGDGIPDTEDPYPIYPWGTVVKRATMEIDGNAEDWKDIPLAGVIGYLGIKFSMRNAYDKDYLYYLFETEGPVEKFQLVVDCDADGFTVGNENLQIIFSVPAKNNDPGEGKNLPAIAELDMDGAFIIRDIGIHMASNRSWPHWDDGRPFVHRFRDTDDEWSFERPKRYGDYQDIKYASKVDNDRKTVEIGIPNGTGRMPMQGGPGHVIAHDIQIFLSGNKPVSIYEPQTFFNMRL